MNGHTTREIWLCQDCVQIESYDNASGMSAAQEEHVRGCLDHLKSTGGRLSLDIRDGDDRAGTCGCCNAGMCKSLVRYAQWPLTGYELCEADSAACGVLS